MLGMIPQAGRFGLCLIFRGSGDKKMKVKGKWGNEVIFCLIIQLSSEHVY